MFSISLSYFQICEIKLSPLPFLSSYQGAVHFKISYIDNAEECVAYKSEVPDMRRTHADGNGSSGSDGIVINVDSCRSLSGDIKVEFYGKHMMRKKRLFSFWFNTFFESERGIDGKRRRRWRPIEFTYFRYKHYNLQTIKRFV